MSEPLTIWRFFDGKAGHRNQVLGLAEALGRLSPVQCFDVPINDSIRGLRGLIPGRLRFLQSYPAADLLIGAGHATHLPLLTAARRFGGRTVVLMKPSLPLGLFDACLIPVADRLSRVPSHVLLTEGALNRIRPASDSTQDKGLILIGGPSEHFGWSDDDILRQLRCILSQSSVKEWVLTTSRRTPASFMERWKASGLPGRMVPVEDTDPDWVPRQLQTAGIVWVTTESVSMIFESLTAGAAVGLLQLTESRSSRVTQGIQSLIQRGLVTRFDDWTTDKALTQQSTCLDEATRCAGLLLQRFFPERVSRLLSDRSAA